MGIEAHGGMTSTEAVTILRDQTIPGLRASGGDGHVAAVEAAMLALEQVQYVSNLLAVIHGDGGHYIDQHGWKKATDDAIEVVTSLRVARESHAVVRIECRRCGRPVEDARRCYVVPLCYACLPTRPLPVVPVSP